MFSEKLNKEITNNDSQRWRINDGYREKQIKLSLSLGMSNIFRNVKELLPENFDAEKWRDTVWEVISGEKNLIREEIINNSLSKYKGEHPDTTDEQIIVLKCSIIAGFKEIVSKHVNEQNISPAGMVSSPINRLAPLIEETGKRGFELDGEIFR